MKRLTKNVKNKKRKTENGLKARANQELDLEMETDPPKARQVAHACNHRYSGGGHQEDCGWRPVKDPFQPRCDSAHLLSQLGGKHR
jgi:hypothetical protein